MSCLLDQYLSTIHYITPKLNLIDCERRRVVNYSTMDQTDLEYVALSYVWGGNSDVSTSISGGSELPTSLPRVIEDAILVTLSLGYRFLWIDRYCIDQHDASNKHEQIMHMDSIYQYAALTIIAAAGTDETYGLPGVSRRRSPSQWSFKGDGFNITSTLPPPQRSIRESRWATRGWTYQEAVLSTRRLVFTDDQLYFECNSMGIYESIQTTRVPISRHPPFEFRNFTTYTRCAEQYSKRILRFDSDSLNAFGGIIRRLETAEKSPVYHVWGVPFIDQADGAGDDTLHPRLPLITSSLVPLFYRGNPLHDPEQTRRIESLMVGLSWCHSTSAVSPRRRAQFPSWSWVGWEGAAVWPTVPQNSPVQGLKLKSMLFSPEINATTWLEEDSMKSLIIPHGSHARTTEGPTTLLYFEDYREEIYETYATPIGLTQLQHPRILCIEAATMSRNALILRDHPQRLCISSGGGVNLYPSKHGLDAVRVFEGIQGGSYEAIRLATVEASSYLMLVELDGQVAYRIGTLVVRGLYLNSRLFKSHVMTYRII
ncbi:heterokaryon incompatibility protein-domain-containing protein [Xylaria sp. FL1042]|nr:heterokaryon incompatibility protein-domain-containing protein [Xylaria sp. FL1042]